MSIDVDEEQFERYVADAMDSLPAEFGERLRNVAVRVEEEGERPNILGLFQGNPETTKGGGGNGTWEPGPRVITIYRRSICRVCDTEEEVARRVHQVVIHEFGHYFGFDDTRLRELGW
jgi:predicted Zn-dependent protease with MMP-like domain